MELVEYSAAREAMRHSNRSKTASEHPDLLAQHLITLALGGGFTAKETLKEVRLLGLIEIFRMKSGAGH